jgi:hypothetical protein
VKQRGARPTIAILPFVLFATTGCSPPPPMLGESHSSAVTTIPCPDFQPSGLAYDGTFLYDAENDLFRTIYKLNPTNGAVQGSFLAPSVTGLDGKGNPSDMVFDGSHLFVTDIGGNSGPVGKVFEIDTNGTTIFNTFGLPFRGGAIAFDGTNLFIGDFDSPTVIVTTRSGTQLRSFNNGLRPAGMVFNPAGRIWVISEFDANVSEINPADGKVLRTCVGPRVPAAQGLGGLTMVGSNLYMSNVQDPNPGGPGPHINGIIYIVDPSTLTCTTNLGAACTTDADCFSGHCCGGGCVDINVNVNHCGGCGRACSSTNVASGGLACSGGLCTSTCATDPIVYGNCSQPAFPTADDGCESKMSNITDSPAGVPISGYTTATFPFANCGTCGTTCTDGSARAAHSTHLCVPTGGGAAACRSFDRAQCVTARCMGDPTCVSTCSTSSSTAGCFQPIPGEVASLAADQGADADGDFLPDAWETSLANSRSGEVAAPAGVNTATTNPVGIDFNCDGSVDATNDFVFANFVASGDMPDPNHKDAYLRIRSMEQEPGTGGACTSDPQCQSTPNCQYPACKLATHHCAVTATSLTSPGVPCSTNTDCQLACPTPYCDLRATLVDGTANPGLNKCSEDPATGHAPDPSGVLAADSVIQMVKDAFLSSSQAIRLHVDYDATPTLSHVELLQVQPCDSCTVTPTGQYFSDVKPQFGSVSELAKIQYVYHFLTFAHSFCKGTGSGATFNSFSGNSEIYGNDSVVTLGTHMFKFDPADTAKMLIKKTATAGTLMHEAGHAFNLIHYPINNLSTGLPVSAPNFISVLNYTYQFGISTAAMPFTALPVTADPAIAPHINYSIALGDTLVESSLVEANGIKAGGYGTNDLISFSCPTTLCNLATGAGCTNFGWANAGSVAGSGIDWNCNNVIDSGTVSVPIDGDGNTTDTLTGWGGTNGDEWGTGVQYGFLCQPTFANGAPLPPDRISQNEVTIEYAAAHHLLSGPPITLSAIARYGCTSPFIFKHGNGVVPLAVLGSASFDVTTIDVSSLSFAGAFPRATDVSDVNGDGFLDLQVMVAQSETNLTTANTTAILSGSLVDGRLFIAPVQVVVSTHAEPMGGSCPHP